jgi:hypothetical protein
MRRIIWTVILVTLIVGVGAGFMIGRMSGGASVAPTYTILLPSPTPADTTPTPTRTATPAIVASPSPVVAATPFLGIPNLNDATAIASPRISDGTAGPGNPPIPPATIRLTPAASQ